MKFCQICRQNLIVINEIKLRIANNFLVITIWIQYWRKLRIFYNKVQRIWVSRVLIKLVKFIKTLSTQNRWKDLLFILLAVDTLCFVLNKDSSKKIVSLKLIITLTISKWNKKWVPNNENFQFSLLEKKIRENFCYACLCNQHYINSALTYTYR